MNKFLTAASISGILAGLLFWLGADGVAQAAPEAWPAEMVSATKHNLSSNTNILFGSSTAGSKEVCVFCHTPHGSGYADLLGKGFPPLWNRKINTYSTYTTYADAPASPNFDAAATQAANGKVKGVSLACLSCHDGTIAFDALINLPGSGGFQSGNRNNPGDGTDHGERDIAHTLFGDPSGPAVDQTTFTFKSADRTGAGDGLPFGGAFYTNNTLGYDDGSNTGGAAPFPNLGTDLRDDHPISFQIPCDNASDPYTETSCADPQFAQVVFGAQKSVSGNLLYLKRASVEAADHSYGVLPQDKRDRIRAYPSIGDTLADHSNNGAYIECASCHNPHTPRTLFLRLPSNVYETGAFAANDSSPTGPGLESGGGTVTANVVGGVPGGTLWSRAPNQGSAICISCHQK